MVLIIRKWISAVLAAALLLSCRPGASAAGAPRVGALCAVVMNRGGEIVYAKNAEKRALIASTTKLMTAIVSLEQAGPSEAVEVRPEHCAVEGSSMYLKPGERYTVRQLVTGLLLVSGNDAALALADHVAGSPEAFAVRMNRKARELGLGNSHFVNPHGLDAGDHYSSAADLARLMAYCMENPDFAAITRMKSFRLGENIYYNHNRLLSDCPGCIGGKTGFTEAAGRCLVSCCEREGTRLICVTLSDPDDWKDHRTLYDWAFAHYGERDVSGEVRFDVEVLSGERASVSVEAQPLPLFLPKNAQLRVEAELPRFVFAPVEAGMPAGKLTVISGGEVLGEADLVYGESVAQRERHSWLWNRIQSRK